MMGDLARARARPWLVGAAVTQLLVCLLVAWAMLWIVFNPGGGPLAEEYTGRDFILRLLPVIALFDLTIAALIGVSTVLVGQAIVSYEVFTGKTLPRRGLLRHWRAAVLLSAAFSLIVGFSIAYPLRPVYGLVAIACVAMLFFALFSWRSFTERERYIQNLRPFVSSEGLYEHMLTHPEDTSTEAGIEAPFEALCRDVLACRVAYLYAVGPLAPLVGPPTTYPRAQTNVPSIGEIMPMMSSPETICVPLDPSIYSGATWAIPLWGDRGMIGVMLLGEKRHGGLYSQEEIETARSSGERLIDTAATVEMARRLMSLQRGRLAESQIVDRRTRRVLHDDILPQLHAAMLALSAGQSGREEAVEQLAGAHRQISDLLRDIPITAEPELTKLGLAGALRTMVDRELPSAFDGVEWRIEEEAERRARELPGLSVEVIYYAAREVLRNAAKHGRDNDNRRALHVTITMKWKDGLRLEIEDDGVGSGHGSGSRGGAGRGLALHTTMMAVIGGTLSVESARDEGTRVVLEIL